MAKTTLAAPGRTRVLLPRLNPYAAVDIDLLVYFTLTKDVDRVSGLNLDGLRPKAEGTMARPDDYDFTGHLECCS